MPSIACPACDGATVERFLDRPRHAFSVFWKDIETIPELDGRFDSCPACGHVFLASAYIGTAYAAAAEALYEG